jgi:hypothetical protein
MALQSELLLLIGLSLHPLVVAPVQCKYTWSTIEYTRKLSAQVVRLNVRATGYTTSEHLHMELLQTVETAV